MWSTVCNILVSDISIHALHEESDQESTLSPLWAVFQSTLSMRRATLHHVAFVHDKAISIHALHEESDPLQWVLHLMHGVISIHALHEESDVLRSRRAVRGVPISIHALHEESDSRPRPTVHIPD